MQNKPAPSQFRERLERLDRLIQESDRLTDHAARAQVQETVRALMDLHGEALGRIVERLADAGPLGQAILDSLAHDEVVSGLLLLYALHPVDLETRVRGGLAKARDYLRSHGGDIEMLSIEDAVVHLRARNSGSCSSSAAMVRAVV